MSMAICLQYLSNMRALFFLKCNFDQLFQSSYFVFLLCEAFIHGVPIKYSKTSITRRKEGKGSSTGLRPLMLTRLNAGNSTGPKFDRLQPVLGHSVNVGPLQSRSMLE
ncbi:hypothetical protein DKX38_013170 [Salix brachista]|uniref:Uncharacterized protein n=1 Tax=Salix brachista TaxID=2182728 RepID=A0A5N5LR22_9ROSI|nr:hypothetical protein DKX38_013170 [Salix brachista]